MERHHELASLARSSFTMATLLFGFTLLLCRCFHLRMYELTSILPLGSVLFYAIGLFWLINAGYQGEKPVHEFAVGTMMNL